MIKVNELKKQLNQEYLSNKEELKHLPTGTLYRSRNSYFIRNEKKLTCITGNDDLISSLIRKYFLNQRQPCIKHLYELLNNQKKKTFYHSPSQILASLPTSYKKVPVVDFYHPHVKRWLNKSHKINPYPITNGGYLTNGGKRVRSKSEQKIANQLEFNQIPFKYDVAVRINSQIKYADFLIMHPFTGHQIIWEHFGALHKEGYIKNMDQKINDYLIEGYVLYDNLIYTLEFDVKDTNQIQRIIDKFIF